MKKLLYLLPILLLLVITLPVSAENLGTWNFNEAWGAFTNTNKVHIGDNKDPKSILGISSQFSQQAILSLNEKGSNGRWEIIKNNDSASGRLSNALQFSNTVKADGSNRNDPIITLTEEKHVGINNISPNSELNVSGTYGEMVRQMFSEQNGIADWRIIKTSEEGNDSRGSNRLIFGALNKQGELHSQILVLGASGHIGLGTTDLPSTLNIAEDGSSAITFSEGSIKFQTDTVNDELQFKSINQDNSLKKVLMKLNHNGNVCIGSGC